MTKRKIRTLILTASFIMFCISLLMGCAGKENSENESNGQKTEHVVTVQSEGGMALSEIMVKVYKDSSQENLVWAAETDEEGKVSFEAALSDSYVAVLEEVPEGYHAEEEYQLESENAEIVLGISLPAGENVMDSVYELGDVMFDFTVAAVDGTEYRLSELLNEKKAVMLNFWFLGCMPCKMEFPYLQQAYEEYQADVEVIAINPMDGTNNTVAVYAQDLGLTFPMAAADANWQSCMDLTAYPTTVMIDRYGTIGLIHRGSITDKETFVKIFDYFTSDDYKQATIRNISDME